MDLTGILTSATLPEFDRILVDAPCSGLGVLQKNPDGKWRVSEVDISRSAQRQLAILECVAPRLRPGGRLVYAVCSFEPEENEGVIEAFLQKHPEFAIDIPKFAGMSQANRFITLQGYFKTLPHLEGMDGFFAAALIKAP
jgi:16S rRNA (cytosine967-C5)-methyltransferase